MKRNLTAMVGLSLGLTALSAQAITIPNTVAVNATDVIYSAGSSSPIGGGTLPASVSLSGATYVTFSSVTGSLTSSGGNACGSLAGCIVLNNGTGNNPNDPDGAGAAVATSSNTGTGSISGITAPGAGYLTGVFVAAGGPSGAAPAALNFTTGTGTAFTSLSPLLDQVFFIGDGLTGDGTGTTQVFDAPSGAVTLYLGISDAGGYNGAPGSYGDNLGTYFVGYNLAGNTIPPNSTPEPLSVGLIGGGMLLLGLLRYRKASAPAV